MFKYFIMNLEGRFQAILPVITDKKNFLYILGSLFLFGVVSKWLVMMSYGRLIRKADHMAAPKSNTLRQIKLKFESVKSVNGVVANPMLLVKRYINKCKFGFISLNKLNNAASWCGLLCIAYGGFAGYILYSQGYGKTTAMSYVLVGGFVGVTLLIMQQSIRISELQNELMYIITDFLENSMNFRERVRAQEEVKNMGAELKILNENLKNAEDNKTDQIAQEMGNTVEQIMGNQEREDDDADRMSLEEEKIIHEVLGEFLQ